MVDGTDMITLRQPMKYIVYNATESLGYAARTFGYSTGIYAGCKPLNDAVLSFKSPICCDALNSLYWIVSPPIIIGLLLLCCGTWVSLYARKRLGAYPWGANYDRANLGGGGTPQAGAEAVMGQRRGRGAGAAPVPLHGGGNPALYTNPTYPKSRR
jgi:hypothetical protein